MNRFYLFLLQYNLAVTVADYANADPAVVKSGRVKKAVANAVEKEGKVYGSALRSLDKK